MGYSSLQMERVQESVWKISMVVKVGKIVVQLPVGRAFGMRVALHDILKNLAGQLMAGMAGAGKGVERRGPHACSLGLSQVFEKGRSGEDRGAGRFSVGEIDPILFPVEASDG